MGEGVVRPRGEAPARPVERARGAWMEVLIGPDEGAPRFVTRRFVLEPGGRIPAHRHPEIEHEQVVVRGSMRIGIGGREHVVRAGDAVFIPAGAVHWYVNEGDEPCEFLCVVPRTERYETEWVEGRGAGPA